MLHTDYYVFKFLEKTVVLDYCIRCKDKWYSIHLCIPCIFILFAVKGQRSISVLKKTEFPENLRLDLYGPTIIVE